MVFESALKTKARKKGTRSKGIKEIRAVTTDTGEHKTVKYVEPERKPTKGNVKGSQQAKRKNKKDLSNEQPKSNANMKAQMDAMMSEIAAMNATIRSLAVGAHGQGRNWQAVNAPNAKPRAGESQFRERLICFQ